MLLKVLKELEKGMKNKCVSEKYGAPRNTVLTLALLEKKGTNSKQQKLRCGDFKKVDKTVYNWFISKRY